MSPYVICECRRAGMEMVPRGALIWIVGNDVTPSALQIWMFMAGIGPLIRLRHQPLITRAEPLDEYALGHCMRLLLAVPEWRARISEMAELSFYWDKIVPHWRWLEVSLLEEWGPALRPKASGAPKTRALLDSILRAVQP